MAFSIMGISCNTIFENMKPDLVIPDADAVPNIAKDVAAFTLNGADGLMTLKLSDRRPEAGELVKEKGE